MLFREKIKNEILHTLPFHEMKRYETKIRMQLCFPKRFKEISLFFYFAKHEKFREKSPFRLVSLFPEIKFLRKLESL